MLETILMQIEQFRVVKKYQHKTKNGLREREKELEICGKENLYWQMTFWPATDLYFVVIS